MPPLGSQDIGLCLVVGMRYDRPDVALHLAILIVDDLPFFTSVEGSIYVTGVSILEYHRVAVLEVEQVDGFMVELCRRYLRTIGLLCRARLSDQRQQQTAHKEKPAGNHGRY